MVFKKSTIFAVFENAERVWSVDSSMRSTIFFLMILVTSFFTVWGWYLLRNITAFNWRLTSVKPSEAFKHSLSEKENVIKRWEPSKYAEGIHLDLFGIYSKISERLEHSLIDLDLLNWIPKNVSIFILKKDFSGLLKINLNSGSW